MARDDVEYISVKVSSVFSQIELTAFRQTVDHVAERLRALYRAAARHRYRHPDGRITPKFINLDMEEYRDLDLTTVAFREVLDEPEFLSLSAGIVLQAYLPDSHRAQRELTAWALARRARGGAPIKLRIVKGANLAMERIEAAVHGWPQAPYETKREVDANYKRMLEYGCRPAHAEAVHLGVASHNLFDVAYGLVLREAHGSSRGSSSRCSRAWPITRRGRSRRGPAVSCCTRRSCAPRTSTARSPISFAAWTRTPRPRTSCATSSISSRAHRSGRSSAIASWRRSRSTTALRCAPPRPGPPRGGAGPRPTQARRAVRERPRHGLDARGQSRVDRGRGRALARASSETIPLQVGGDLSAGAREEDGHDPSRPGRAAYRYARAGLPTSIARWRSPRRVRGWNALSIERARRGSRPARPSSAGGGAS